jgi:hypothetical protein
MIVNYSHSRRCICGETRQARIVCPPGDNCTAGIGTLPWQAGLVFRGSWQPWCGASLISDSYLVNNVVRKAVYFFRNTTQLIFCVIEFTWLNDLQQLFISKISMSSLFMKFSIPSNTYVIHT